MKHMEAILQNMKICIVKFVSKKALYRSAFHEYGGFYIVDSYEACASVN